MSKLLKNTFNLSADISCMIHPSTLVGFIHCHSSTI